MFITEGEIRFIRDVLKETKEEMNWADWPELDEALEIVESILEKDHD